MASPVTPDPSQEGAEGNDGPKLNPLEAALASAREAQQSGKGIMAAQDDDKPDDSDAGDDAGDEEDEGDGEEGTDDEGDEGEGEEEGSDEGDDEDEGDEATGEGDEGVGDDAGEGEGGEGEEGEEGIVVTLPPRREGDDDFELVVETEEAAERIRQLRNGYMTGSQVAEAQDAIDRDRQQIDELEVWIGTDPTGFILQNTPAEVIEDVALSLVLQPEIFDKLQERIRTALDDPQERRVLTAELKAARHESQQQLQQVLETRRFAKEQAKIVRDSIQKMVPETEGISDTRRQAIIQSLEQAAAQTIRSKKIEKIEVDDVPLMLAAQLRAAGIDPQAAAAALKDGGSDSEPGKRPAKKKKKQPTKAELKAKAEKKKKAAASTPPGGGAPASRKKLPKGQTLEERFKLVREKGLGAVLGR